ncbi:ESAT-6 like protein EsxJ, partial [Mycobacterium tuberculosis TKK_05SA_0058]
QASQQILSS